MVNKKKIGSTCWKSRHTTDMVRPIPQDYDFSQDGVVGSEEGSIAGVRSRVSKGFT